MLSSPQFAEEGTNLLSGTSVPPLGDNEPAEHVNGARFFLTKARSSGEEKLKQGL